MALEELSDYKYIGSYIASTKGRNVSKGLAWKAVQTLDAIWHSDISPKIKTNTFSIIVERVLMYRTETWSLKTADLRTLDGTYTKMLQGVFAISWKFYTSNIATVV